MSRLWPPAATACSYCCQRDPNPALLSLGRIPAMNGDRSPVNPASKAAEPRAYSYLRFSTPEQSKGDSLRRQTALAEEYAQRHGLTLDTELNLKDLGISAYRGDNAAVGALGAFLKAIRDGLV